MSRSISHFSETDLDIHNTKKKQKKQTDVDIRFLFS